MDIYSEDFGFTYSDHRRIDEFLSALEELCFLSHLSENIRTYGLTEPVRHVLDYDKTSVMLFGAESLNNIEMTPQAALEGLVSFIGKILKAIKDFFVWFFKLIGRVFFGYKETKEKAKDRFEKKKSDRDYFKDKNTSSEDKEYSEDYWKKRKEEAQRQYDESKKRAEEEHKKWRETQDKERARKQEEQAKEEARRREEEAKRAKERAERAQEYANTKIIKYKGARFRMVKVVAIDEFLQKACSTKYESLEAFYDELKKIPNIDIFSDKCNYTMWIEVRDKTPILHNIDLSNDEEMKKFDIKESGWDDKKIADIGQYFYQVFVKLGEDDRIKQALLVSTIEEKQLRRQAEELEKLGENASKEDLEKIRMRLHDVIVINKLKAAMVHAHATAISRVVDLTDHAIQTLRLLHSWSQQ